MITEAIYETLVKSGVNVEQTIQAFNQLVGNQKNPEAFWKEVGVFAIGGVAGSITWMSLGHELQSRNAESHGLTQASIDTGWVNTAINCGVGFGLGVLSVGVIQVINIASAR